MKPHSALKKRKLGVYYTPPELSQMLADWAIISANETILEPSFGGCGFLDSCCNRLKYLGCLEPERQLYGVDIDKHAFEILDKKFKGKINTVNQFILQDFITVNPEQLKAGKFDIVIGNPPYVSMHNMTEMQRKSCENILKNSPFIKYTIGRNASLWAFFLLHSLSFLKDGGRVAWVLPSSLLHADYAKKLIEIFQCYFLNIKIVKLAERFFKGEGAKEASIILLAEGFNSSTTIGCSLRIDSVESLTNLEKLIYSKSIRKDTNIGNYKINLLTEEVKNTYLGLLAGNNIKSLGDYVDIKIGMVTGNNNFFIINNTTVDKYCLPEEVLIPVISRFSLLKGTTHTKRKQEKLLDEDKRVFLFCPSESYMKNPSIQVIDYINQMTEDKIENNKTFKKRPNWFSPGYGIDGIISDCFLSYMIHHGPRMVVNQAKFNCTNSIHKVIFHDKKTKTNTKIALSLLMLSSLSQFSAELEGRAYSSGVLKIEPSSGKKIKVMLSDNCIDDLLLIKNFIDKKIENSEFFEATKLVDQVLIKNGLITKRQCDFLIQGINELRQERYRGVKKYNAE
ncbi:HsdM family class I SAM-dependent methyltransferase [Providencia rettgeri]|nr:N-6 DNA methylase [Providencia rettgeri]